MKLQKLHVVNKPGIQYWFWCPGCDMWHRFNVGNLGGPTWKFNGNMEQPTFTPSLHYPDVVCHLILTDGILRFIGDCTHALRSQSVPLPDIPEDAYRLDYDYRKWGKIRLPQTR